MYIIIHFIRIYQIRMVHVYYQTLLKMKKCNNKKTPKSDTLRMEKDWSPNSRTLPFKKACTITTQLSLLFVDVIISFLLQIIPPFPFLFLHRPNILFSKSPNIILVSSLYSSPLGFKRFPALNIFSDFSIFFSFFFSPSQFSKKFD